MRKITLISIMLVISLFSLPACASGIALEEYDKVKDELSTIQSQLASLQSKLAESEIVKANLEVLLNDQYDELSQSYDTVVSEYESLQAKFDDLSTEYEDLGKQLDAVRDEYETLQAQYEDLLAEYDVLRAQYDIVTEEPAVITEEDVEQALFNLVNQGRVTNGLDEQLWGINIYKWATENSRNMATNRRIEYSSYASWQAVEWATGYDTTDEMAEAVMTMWRNTRNYERTFLNINATYGTVAVYKSEEIYYITYIASNFR
ncbi:MAG: hypothetical protein IIB13_04670 [Chloroflexi bacterium]|nr:hypothetical protein [Chloroflexota bacterium]